MRENMMDKSLSPIHPGEVLLEDFMKPLGLSQYRLAQGNRSGIAQAIYRTLALLPFASVKL